MKICLSTARKPYELEIREDRPEPPAAGEIQVRMEASCINFHDFGVVSGRKRIRDGLVPLTDGAGIVEAIGEGVNEFAIGDRVISLFFPQWAAGPPTMRALYGVPGDQVDGFAATHVTKPATAFTRAPDGLTPIEAATLPCAALTAWRALFVEARLRPGDWVVTQGTGGVSIFALQLAKAAGARVICTTSSAQKADRLTALGAEAVLNYREDPKWGKAVVGLTGGQGADIVVEVGGGGTLAQSVLCCRVGGTIPVIGVLTGTEGNIPVAALLARNIRLAGLSVGSRADQNRMVAALEATALRPVVDRVFALRDIAEAFRYHEEGRHFGKICLEH